MDSSIVACNNAKTDVIPYGSFNLLDLTNEWSEQHDLKYIQHIEINILDCKTKSDL